MIGPTATVVDPSGRCRWKDGSGEFAMRLRCYTAASRSADSTVLGRGPASVSGVTGAGTVAGPPIGSLARTHGMREPAKTWP